MLRSPHEHLLTKHRQLPVPLPPAALHHEDTALLSSALLSQAQVGLWGHLLCHCPPCGTFPAPLIAFPKCSSCHKDAVRMEKGSRLSWSKKGDLGCSQHWGWGQCHGMLWDSPGSLHLTGEGFLLAAWSWFMLHSWAPPGWDVLLVLSLQSGRKIHFGNYLFSLARVSQLLRCSRKTQSAERSPHAALLQVRTGDFRICVFTRYSQCEPVDVVGQDTSQGSHSLVAACAVTPQGLGLFFPFFFKQDISGFPF